MNSSGAVASVRLGEHDKNVTNESQHIDVNVIQIIPYPSYRRDRHYNDIGLLKLERKVQFTDTIRPACLPEEPFTSDKALATGWGYVKDNDMSSVLMKVLLDVFDQNKCSQSNPPNPKSLQGVREQTQFCAGSDTHINNTCFGDSGGPIQISHKDHFCTFTIIGVTSFGHDCRGVNYRSIGIYTRVLPYVSWIESIVWAE